MIKITLSTLVAFFLICAGFSQTKNLNLESANLQPIDSCLSWMRKNAYTGKDLDSFHSAALLVFKRIQNYHNS